MRLSSSILDAIEQHAIRQPERCALQYLVDGNISGRIERLSFEELTRRARAIGRCLSADLAPGARVLLVYPPGLEFVSALLGCLYAGAVAVPTDAARWERSQARLATMVESSGARVAMTTQRYLQDTVHKWLATDALRALRWISSDDLPSDDGADRWLRGAAGDDIAYLQYTSGSTGDPKGVAITHRNVLDNTARLHDVGGVAEGAHSVSWAPMHHDMGLIAGVMYPLCHGFLGTVLSPLSFLRRPARWLEAISRLRGTFSTAPNFALDLCVRRIPPTERHELDLSSWSYLGNGAEPVRLDTQRSFVAAFEPHGFRREALRPCYGLAESTLIVTAASRTTAWKCHPVESGGKARAVLSCGAPVAGAEVVIVDPDARTRCSPGEAGEVWVRGPSVASGYWNRARNAPDAFDARLDDGEGPFLRTGDLGLLVEGELYLTGRQRDLIVVRGQNHFPQDLEATVETCSSAIRAACTAAFSIDVDGEERVVIAAELDPMSRDPRPAVAQAIREAVAREHDLELHAIALLKARTLPKTTSGKICRSACREAFAAGSLAVAHLEQAQPAVDATRTVAQLETWLALWLSVRLGVKPREVPLDGTFASLGMGSSQLVELSAELQDWLRAPVTPVDLYRHPTVGKLASALGASERTPESPRRPTTVPRIASTEDAIAIVGIACRFPHAHGPDELWSLLHDGVDATSTVPASRWNADELYSPHGTMPGKTNTRRGGFLEDVAVFDPEFFGISAAEASNMDPQHRLLLEVAWEALEDAGIPVERLEGSDTGVFVGLTNSDYGRMQLGAHAHIGPYAATGSVHCLAANRISYTFDFRGPSLTIDTACSSSLVAIHYACESIRRGESPLALAGGVNLLLAPVSTVALSQVGALSPDGRCYTFDARANGYARGEGAGLVLMRPLRDAVANRDRIYAVIRGSGVNQDGRSNGMRAPNPEAQTALMRKVWASAGIASEHIQYVEAHGTGTALGDPIEASAIGAAVGGASARTPPCAIGSVKSNFGHLESAAGVAGLMKVALALHHRQLPPSLHFRDPNPRIPFHDLGLQVQTTLEPWTPPGDTRYAAVNSFGVGGTNAHVVLEQAPEMIGDAESSTRPSVLLLSAHGERSLKSLAARYAERIDRAPYELTAITRTAAMRRTHLDHRLATVARTAKEISDRLRGYADGTSAVGLVMRRVGKRRRRLAFVYPGQGPQYLGMGRRLLETEPAFRDCFERCDQLMLPHLRWSVRAELFADESRSRLTQDAVAQPVLFALQASLTALWRSWGVTPDAVVGHSMGEVAAATCAGALTLEQAAHLTCVRSRSIVQFHPGEGGMAVIALSLEDTRAALDPFDGRLHLAASNGPLATVVSGDLDAIADLLSELQRRDVFCRAIKAKGAGHSPAVEPIAQALREGLSALKPRATTIPFYSAVTGQIAQGESLDASYWARSMRDTVMFCPAIRQLVSDEYDVFLEQTSSATLVPAIQHVMNDAKLDGYATCALAKDRDDQEAVLLALAGLHSAGCSVDLARVFGANCNPAQLPLYPWSHKRYWADFATEVPRDAPPFQRASRGTDSGDEGEVETVSSIVVSAWKSVLNVGMVGHHDNFFELGGTSLSASQMLFEVRSTLQRNISTRLLFEHPTLSAFIDAVSSVTTSPTPMAGIPRTNADMVPLTFQQIRSYRHSPTAFEAHFELSGDLDEGALTRSLLIVAQRHDAFGIRFREEQGQPWQCVEPVHDVVLDRHDLAELDATVRDTALRDLLRSIERPFDLTQERPYRMQLVRTEPAQHVLSLAFQHSVFDFWSFGIFLRELAAAYEAGRRGGRPQLPALPIRFVDFAAWQRSELTGGRLEACLQFWRERTSDLTPTEPKLGVPLWSSTAPTGTQVFDFALSSSLHDRVCELAGKTSCTKRFVFVSGLLAVLQRDAGTESACLAMLEAGRQHPETQSIIGFFSQHRLVKVGARRDMSVSDYVAAVRDAVLTAEEQQVLSAVDYHCVFENQAEPDSLRWPILLNYLPTQPLTPTFEGLRARQLPRVTPHAARFPLHLAAMELPQTIACRVTSALHLAPARVRAFFARLEAALSALTSNSDGSMRDVLNGVPDAPAERDDAAGAAIRQPAAVS